MPLLRLLAAIACVAALTAQPAAAQRTPAPQHAPAAATGGEAWYRQQLVDLAEVLGGAHYLRITCSGRGDQRWRDYMRGVIDREPGMRQALSDSFNQGYRTESTRFPECDRNSQQTEAELRARGLRIAGALGARGAAQ